MKCNTYNICRVSSRVLSVASVLYHLLCTDIFLVSQVQGSRDSQSNVASYCKVLSKILPKKVRLHRFDYKSIGILSYYNNQMDEMLQFSDLRTVVFQAFREIGNAVLFTLHLEQALVS